MTTYCTLETTLDDCLSLISAFLSGTAIFRLYCTSTILKKRLLSGSIVKYLRWGQDEALVGFPKFAYQFRNLETFVLSVTNNLALESKFRGEDLMNLPPTLEKLVLRFRGAHSIWFRQYGPVMIGNSHSSNVSVANANYKEMYDVKSAFPVLQTIDLMGEDILLGLSVMPFFAPSLTSVTCETLKLTSFRLNIPLPPQLLVLNLPLCNSFDQAVLLGLPQLEVLKISEFGQPHIEWLPPNLTKLQLFWDIHDWTQKGLEALASLAHLKTLQCASPDPLDYLPPSLTDLQISASVITEESVKTLPRNLLRFKCSLLTGSFENFSFWPPHLQHLEFILEDGENFGPKDARWLQLPQSLTSLKVNTTSRGPFHIHPTMLPPSIKSISPRFTELEGEIDMSFMHSLHTIYLQLAPPIWPPVGVNASSTAPTSPIQDSPTANQLISHSLFPTELSPALPEPFRFIFPHKLQVLDWSCVTDTPPLPASWRMKDRFASWLPQSLTALHCNDSRDLSDAFLIALPQSIRSLSLETKGKEMPSHFTSHGLKSLPSGLITLTIPLNPDSDASFVPFLPKRLESVRIDRISIFPDSMVPHLPPGLCSLFLRDVDNGFTDNCLPDLPKTLTTLHLQSNISLTPEALFSIPPCHLKSLDIRSNPNFSKTKILQLAPPKLSIKAKKFVK